MAPCPRCGRENPPTAGICGLCRTPLAFGDDPVPGRFDVDLDLDRRRRGRDDPAAPEGPAGRAAPSTFEPERSDWEIGAPLEGAGDSRGGGSVVEPAGERDGGDDLEPAPAARRIAAWAVDAGLVAVAAVGLPAALLASNGTLIAAGSLGAAFEAGLAVVIPAGAFVAVAAFVYATVAHALAGATLGKRLARIRVVGPDGAPPGLGRSAARTSWLAASIALGGLGLLPALVTPSRRALHDLLAGTRVVLEP